MLDKIRGAIRRRPISFAIAAAVVALVVGTVIGAAGPNAEVADLKADKAALRRDLASTQENLDIVNADYDTAADDLIAMENAVNEIGNLEARKRALSRKIAGLEEVRDLQVRKARLGREVSDLRGQIQAEEAKLTTTKANVAKSSFSDGTWESNVDFIPGTYQADGGEGCYWEKLSGPSGGGTDNIIDNGFGDARPVVSVDSPYFSTSDCGTWKRTG